MSDTDAIDEALVATLADDSALMALMTDGVFFDVAKPGATKFVIVSMVIGQDDYGINQEHASETVLYTVQAVEKSTNTTNTKAASKRIHALLQNAALTITGYNNVIVRRMERVRYQEIDEDTQERFQHRGGRYEVWAAPSS